MARPHPRIYRRPKPVEDAESERILSADRHPDESGPVREQRAIDYRPTIAVIGVVVFGLR